MPMQKEKVIQEEIAHLDEAVIRAGAEVVRLLSNQGNDFDLAESAKRIAVLADRTMILLWVLGERDLPR